MRLTEPWAVRFRFGFETVELPMLEQVISIPLFLLRENQSKIQRSMLYFEPERTHNIQPQHLGGAHDEQVNAHFSALKRVHTRLRL
jgi:hypothetical protein